MHENNISQSLESKNVKSRENFLKLGIFLFPIFVFLIYVIGKITIGPLFLINSGLVQEDGLIEYTTSIVYFLTGIFSFLIFQALKKNHRIFGLMYLIFGIIFLIGGFEEISWGQRIFDLETPDMLSSNLAEEINIHNLKGFERAKSLSHLFIAFYAIFTWLILPRKNNPTYKMFVRFFVPRWYTITYFFTSYLFLIYFDATFTHLKFLKKYFFDFLQAHQDEELFEMMLSLGVLIFVFEIFYERKVKSSTKNFLPNINKKRRIIIIAIFLMFIVGPISILTILSLEPTTKNFQLYNVVKVDRQEIFMIMSNIENYPNVFPDNIKSVKIINQTNNLIIAEEKITERGLDVSVLVQHTIIPYDTHTIEILNGPLDNTKIILTYNDIEGGTEIKTDVELRSWGILNLFFDKKYESNYEHAMNTVISTFEEYAKNQK